MNVHPFTNALTCRFGSGCSGHRVVHPRFQMSRILGRAMQCMAWTCHFPVKKRCLWGFGPRSSVSVGASNAWPRLDPKLGCMKATRAYVSSGHIMIMMIRCPSINGQAN